MSNAGTVRDRVSNASVLAIATGDAGTEVIPILNKSTSTASDVASVSEVKKLTWVGLAFIAYSFTAAGPFGVEEAVKSGGPLVTLIALVIVPSVYVIPQIFIVAEMATMMPSSHGSVLWVQRAFGNGAGFFNSITSVIYNFVDAAVYPNLFAAYISSVFLPEATYWEKIGIGFSCILIGTALSLLSARMVGHAATLMSFTVMGPFIIGFIAGAKYIDKDRVGEIRAVYNDNEYDFGTLLSTLIWLFTGWRSMGTMGGEISHPHDFLKGLPLALFLGLASYLGPLLVGVSMNPPPNKQPWEEGYLAVIFNEVMPGLGTGVAVAGALGNICLFSSAMLCYPRMLWGVAERGWAPAIFAVRHPRTQAPYMAVLMHFFVACAFLFLKFNVLVRLEAFIGAGSYILSAVCLVKLRWSEPDTHRPIMFPKSFAGACILVSGPVLTFSTMLFFNIQTWWIAVAGLSVYGGVIALYFVLLKIRGAEAMTPPPMEESPRSGESLATLEHAAPFDGATSPTWIPFSAK